MSVEVATSFPERFQPGARLSWQSGAQTRDLTLSSCRPHGRRWLLRFEGVGDVESARALQGGELLVAEADATPAPPGFYYSHRIEGWLCEDTDGRPLGTVAGLEQTAAGPLLTVRTLDGGSALIPFVASIVVAIDEEDNRVILDPPLGLLDL